MIIIGITGSIGTGKTTVSKMLRILKIPIFDSDNKVKEILDRNQHVIDKILKIWPQATSTDQIQRKIDKRVLSNEIFKNKKEKDMAPVATPPKDTQSPGVVEKTYQHIINNNQQQH